MTKLYKLTNQCSQTFGQCQWGENVPHAAPGNGKLCSSAWLHAYTHPVLALLLNPIHANIADPQLWECEGTVGITDHGLKVGCTSLTTLRQLPVPKITSVNRVAFAIGCAYNVYSDYSWVEWARRWVLNRDRSAVACGSGAAAAYKAVAAAVAPRGAAAAARAAAVAAEAAGAAAARGAAAAVAARGAAAAYEAAATAAAAARGAFFSAIVVDIPFTALSEWAMRIS